MSGADLSGWRILYEAESDPKGEWRWRDDLNCLDLSVNHFFPISPGGRRRKGVSESDGIAAAKAVCNGSGGTSECPVRDQCREYAVNNPSLVGIWGGTTEDERKKIRKARREAVAGEKGAAA